MPFPDQTIKQAKWIADMYKARSGRRYNQALRLFQGQFLHLNYGFDDVLRTGHCGTYLHEARQSAECFSKVGMDYVIAKELGLKPKMYWASGMRDVKEGRDPRDSPSLEHGFLSVQIGNKEYMVDPYLNLFGEMKIGSSKITVSSRGKGFGNIKTQRSYSSLQVISEEEYVEKLEEQRKGDGGRILLSCGQKIRCMYIDVIAQYLEQPEKLITTVSWPMRVPLYYETASRNIVHRLSAPLRESGKWDLDEAVFSAFRCESAGWMEHQFVQPDQFLNAPLAKVRKYLDHIAQAAAHAGLRTPLRNTYRVNQRKFLERLGFNDYGRVSSGKGVSAKEHDALIEELLTMLEPITNPELQKELDHYARYNRLTRDNKSESNPAGLLASPEEIKSFVDEHVELIRENLLQYANTAMLAILAQARLTPGKSMREREARSFNNSYRNRPVGRFDTALVSRGRNREAFEKFIDLEIFMRKNPVGHIVATDDERHDQCLRKIHTEMISAIDTVRALELRQHQRNLQRILRKREQPGNSALSSA